MLKSLIIATAMVVTLGAANAATLHSHHRTRHHYGYHHTRSLFTDPSYRPETAQFRAYQNSGRCVIDEGYGRYTFCDGGF